MSKKTKNPAKRLSSIDKEILERVVFIFALKFYSLTQEYPNPKEYVESIILKAIQPDKIAALYTAMYAKNNPSNNYSFTPRELNQRLANDLLSSIQENQKFMHSRDLREKVLKKLEDHGILLHLEGKEEITKRRYGKRGPGRPSRWDTENDRGGRPSLYMTTEEFEKLKKAIKKPGALDFLHDKIIKTGLALKLFEYQALANLYAAKMDEQVAQKLVGIGATFLQAKVSSNDSSRSASTIHHELQTLNDEQLEQVANNLAKSVINTRNFYSLLLIPGLLKL